MDICCGSTSRQRSQKQGIWFWGGFDTYEGALAGVQVGDRDLFGYGRPLTATIEVSQRSYRGEILYEDPFFFDTDFVFTARAFALTFDYDGYTKFEVGGRFELSRKITKYDEASLTFSARHVDITDSQIRPSFLLGPDEYQVDTIGLTNTLDFRESPYVNPRGFLVGNTFDVASSALGSDIEFIRSTMRVGYYLPFGPKPLTPGVVEDQPAGTPLQRWFRQSSIAFGARAGLLIRSPKAVRRGNCDSYRRAVFQWRRHDGTQFGERELGRTIITVIRSAENFLPSSTLNTHSHFRRTAGRRIY
jgi:Outer membrane protein/protective antigen OMA87